MYENNYEIQVKEGEPFPVRLTGQIACTPFEEYLGIKIEEAGRDKTVLSMPFKTKLAQAKGLMHGGAIAALAHSALAVAIKTQLPRDNDFEIITFSLCFHLPVRGGFVKAVGKITEIGERDIRGEVLVYNDRGEKTATFGAAYRKNRACKIN